MRLHPLLLLLSLFFRSFCHALDPFSPNAVFHCSSNQFIDLTPNISICTARKSLSTSISNSTFKTRPSHLLVRMTPTIHQHIQRFSMILWPSLFPTPIFQDNQINVYQNVRLTNNFKNEKKILGCLFDFALVLGDLSSKDFYFDSLEAFSPFLNQDPESAVCYLPTIFEHFSRSFHGYSEPLTTQLIQSKCSRELPPVHSNVAQFTQLMESLCRFSLEDDFYEDAKCYDPLLHILYMQLKESSTRLRYSLLEIASLLTLIPSFPRSKLLLWREYLEHRGVEIEFGKHPIAMDNMPALTMAKSFFSISHHSLSRYLSWQKRSKQQNKTFQSFEQLTADNTLEQTSLRRTDSSLLEKRVSDPTELEEVPLISVEPVVLESIESRLYDDKEMPLPRNFLEHSIKQEEEQYPNNTSSEKRVQGQELASNDSSIAANDTLFSSRFSLPQPNVKGKHAKKWRIPGPCETIQRNKAQIQSTILIANCLTPKKALKIQKYGAFVLSKQMKKYYKNSNLPIYFSRASSSSLKVPIEDLTFTSLLQVLTLPRFVYRYPFSNASSSSDHEAIEATRLLLKNLSFTLDGSIQSCHSKLSLEARIVWRNLLSFFGKSPPKKDSSSNYRVLLDAYYLIKAESTKTALIRLKHNISDYWFAFSTLEEKGLQILSTACPENTKAVQLLLEASQLYHSFLKLFFRVPLGELDSALKTQQQLYFVTDTYFHPSRNSPKKSLSSEDLLKETTADIVAPLHLLQKRVSFLMNNLRFSFADRGGLLREDYQRKLTRPYLWTDKKDGGLRPATRTIEEETMLLEGRKKIAALIDENVDEEYIQLFFQRIQRHRALEKMARVHRRKAVLKRNMESFGTVLKDTALEFPQAAKYSPKHLMVIINYVSARWRALCDCKTRGENRSEAQDEVILNLLLSAPTKYYPVSLEAEKSFSFLKMLGSRYRLLDEKERKNSLEKQKTWICEYTEYLEKFYNIPQAIRALKRQEKAIDQVKVESISGYTFMLHFYSWLHEVRVWLRTNFVNL